MRRGWAAFTAAMAVLALVGSGGAANAPARYSGVQDAIADPHDVSILSYNVEGLPWPIASGRAEAAGTIAATLADMRLAGRQPHIVAVQEAFSAAAKAIGQRAGYRFSASGPSESDPGAPATGDRDRSFAAAASFWKGETLGRLEDSGLAIFSDYPIRWVKRMAFPEHACAGFDCLANKGVLIVALDVPGAARPLIMIDTHLNSRTASHVSDDRSLYAFTRQVDMLGPLVAAARREGDVVVVGDFNVGKAPGRSAYLDQRLLGAGGFAFAAVEHGGALHRTVDAGGPLDATSLAGAKSLMAFAGRLQPVGVTNAFGRRADGGMLSDHLGIERHFRLAGVTANMRVAMR